MSVENYLRLLSALDSDSLSGLLKLSAQENVTLACAVDGLYNHAGRAGQQWRLRPVTGWGRCRPDFQRD